MNKERQFLPGELKLFRARLGFTQQKLARELGVSRVSVVRWETGTYKVPYIVKLALQYLEYKLFGRENPSTLPPETD